MHHGSEKQVQSQALQPVQEMALLVLVNTFHFGENSSNVQVFQNLALLKISWCGWWQVGLG